jgi:hypothetical protein
MQIFLRRFFLGLILFATTLAPSTVFAQLPDVVLTDNAKVSLLTCSQGEELYSIFGHSAIRVADPQVGVDWVFNYGTFDFSDPKFTYFRFRLIKTLSDHTFSRGDIFTSRY